MADAESASGSESDEDGTGTSDEAASDPPSSDNEGEGEVEVPASFDSGTTWELPGPGPCSDDCDDGSSSDSSESDTDVPNLPADARGNTGLGFNLRDVMVDPLPPDSVDDMDSKEPMPMMDESAPKDVIITPAKRPACFGTSSEPKTAKLKVSDDES